MKLVQVAGYLGSGKTTFIVTVAKRLSSEGVKIAILVNDVGGIPVDGKVMEEYGLSVKEIGGGCICCQIAGNLRKTLGILARTYQPDIVVIEPTGMAVPGSVKDVVRGGGMDVSFGPIVVLFDLSRAEKLLKFDPLRRLVSTQIADADIIALSKADTVSAEQVEDSRRAVSSMNPGARTVTLSVNTGEGVDEVLEAIKSVTVSA
ncbi:MAG: GTP-binding protein [Nitrospirota bacterium]|jgi:G3E family GTPase